MPELRLADPDVTKNVTIRHLLTHTSGIDGDVFTDTGRGDDCLEKYVDVLAEAAQNHPLGATWSYCNSGFSLLGRVIEKLTGTTWDQAMRDRLFTPLGLARTVTLPEEALLHSAAVGHIDVDGEQVPSPTWGLMRSVGPAGLVTSTVADVLAFARMHLAGGLAADGTRVLSEDSATAMTAHEADLPDKYILGDSWGLGWIRFGWDGQRLIGHDGNTLGQAAFLRILPEQGLAVALLTNGGHTRDLYEDLYRELFAELADVEMPRPLTPPEEPVTVDVTPYVGRYERASVLMEVLADGPTLRTTITGPLAEMVPDPVEEYPLVAVGPGAVRGQAAGGRDLGAGDLLRAADRRALRALRRPCHTAGRLMDLSLVLSDLRELVECESPSSDLAAVGRSADVVARIGTARLGVAPEYVVVDGRTHLRWRLGAGPSRVLVLGHHDTVWPLGSLATHPWSVEGGVVRGPGCFDMKAGLAMAFHALAGLDDRDGVTLLVTGDEEIGSPTSRALIEEEAREASAALVLEASADGGALKTARKGVSLYDVRVLGRASHAGLEPELGVNATLELAHQALVVSALADPARGTTVTPTVMRAGTTTNTVPAEGSFAVDVRVRTPDEQERVDAALRSLRTVVPGAALEITGGPNRPPLEAVGVGGAVRAGACSWPSGSVSRNRWRPPSAVAPTATSRPASARRPSTASVPSEVAPTAPTSTSWSTRFPVALLCSPRSSGTCWRTRRPLSRRRVPTDHDGPRKPRRGPPGTTDPGRHGGGPGGAGRRRRSPRRRLSRCARSPSSSSSRTWCGCSRRSGVATPTRP